MSLYWKVLLSAFNLEFSFFNYHSLILIYYLIFVMFFIISLLLDSLVNISFNDTDIVLYQLHSFFIVTLLLYFDLAEYLIT